MRRQVVNAALERHARFLPGGRALDFGGGTGVFARILTDRGMHVTVLDRSFEMVKSGLRDHKEAPISWAIGTADALRPGVTVFDVVLAVAVLEYVEDLPGTVATLAGSLKPGGILILTVPDPRSPVRRVERLADAAAVRLGRMTSASRLIDREYSSTRPGGSRLPWREALESAGLEVQEVVAIPLGSDTVRKRLHPNVAVTVSKPVATSPNPDLLM